MTFWQQLVMALAHGGPPSLVAFFAYLKLRRRQDIKHEQIVVLLNGGLKDKIKKAVEEAMKA